MRLFRRTLIVIGTIVTVGVAGAGGAQASTRNPDWEVGGSTLGEGVSGELFVSGSTNQVLTTASLTIECTNVAANSEATVWGGSPGTAKTVLTYTGCGVPGKPSCKVETVSWPPGTVETQPLDATLGFTSKLGAEEENASRTLLTVVPENAEALISEIEVTGTCPSLTTGKHKLTGEWAYEIETTGFETEALSLRAPITAIKTFWHNVAGAAKSFTVKAIGMTPFGACTISGGIHIDIHIGNITLIQINMR